MSRRFFRHCPGNGSGWIPQYYQYCLPFQLDHRPVVTKRTPAKSAGRRNTVSNTVTRMMKKYGKFYSDYRDAEGHRHRKAFDTKKQA
ncbi:MAG: hypothetical protein WA798_17930, partial [Candidatus Acidiferrum sp.]